MTGNPGKSITLCDVSRCVLITELAQENIWFGRNRRVGRPPNRVRALQNDALRKLAQKLPEQDNQPTIIDGLKEIREINNISPCLRPCLRPERPSLRRNRTSLTVMFLSSVGAPFLRPGLRFHRAACGAAVKGSAPPRGATRSRLFVASMARTA